MNSFLLIAVYGATLAIALAFTFTFTVVNVEIHSKNRILSPPMKYTGEKRFQAHRI